MKLKIKKTDVVYIDMDGVLVEKEICKSDFESNRLKKHFFLNKEPINDAIESFKIFAKNCNVYILSTPVWDNEYCWSEKRVWVKKHLGEEARKKLILTHNKSLNKGKLLIDDSVDHGVENFEGIHFHFGTDEFKNWKEILENIDFINDDIATSPKPKSEQRVGNKHQTPKKMAKGKAGWPSTTGNQSGKGRDNNPPK